jgi:hypothetical protein
MSILFDVLREAGDEGEDRDKLAAVVGPPSLAKSDDADEDNAFIDCLALGQDLGVFLADQDRVRLAEPVRASGDGFLKIAVRLMVDEVETAVPAQGWVAGAIAWMLCQDPLDPLPWTGSGAATRILNQLGPQNVYGMTNTSPRFQQAVYWARALGFVTRMNLREEVVVPDPTAALLARLDTVLPAGGETTLATFISDLGRLCPVFDGGVVRREVANRIGAALDEKATSPSLALALHRAKQRGELHFKMLSDAEVVFVPGMLGDGRVSHVSRPGART